MYLRSVVLILFILAACTGKERKSADDPVRTDPSENITTACSYENPVSELGQGLVIGGLRFSVYRDAALAELMFNVDLSSGKTPAGFCPKFLKSDYGIAHLICLEASQHHYKVLVDSSRMAYLPKVAGNFVTWEEYIVGSMGIRRKDNDTQQLKVAPDDGAANREVPAGHELFCAMEMKDDWVRVTYDCHYNLEENPYEGMPCHEYIDKCTDPLTGWLRWKEGSKVRVDVFLFP